MPSYSEYHPSRLERASNQNAPVNFTSQAATDNMNGTNTTFDVAPNQRPPVDLNELMEPAIDGPPSPERIRQLSKQMKHASHLNRSHRAASSGSSSLLSSERPGWEQTFDNMSITRQSSQRSTTSGSPSRDRPDSVQVLGKNIFHRRAKSSKSGRSKRESSAHSSSGSSLYSAETTSENSLATFKESFMPTIFARRKTTRDESVLQKKLQISGPFNFQHVTHTPREQIANLQRGSRMELMSEMSTLRTPGPMSAGIQGPEGQDLHFANFSSEHIAEAPSASTQRASMGPRRLIKHARSQEQLRKSPPRPVRPPRSPIEPLHSPTLPPVPPPRVSSRQSTLRDGETATMAGLDRPQTSGGFRRPRPFSPDENIDQPPTTSPGFGAVPESEALPVDEHRFSHAITTPDDAAWPLGVPGTAPFESPLPDVPEEEEHFVQQGRSPASLTSNRSSLRASQSVPVLRGFAQSQRPMSGASDTLGPLESPVAHRRGVQHEGGEADAPAAIRESWEDDIDYCYEHEADANFDYEWERPSMDVGRDMPPPPVQVALVEDELREVPTIGTAESSPGMLSASRFDMPALSPASQASPPIGHEAVTPSSAVAVTSNFSFPRGEKAARPPNLSHSRSDSRASSFKESHGFTLSPSLLIPGDYHQQMLLNEAERHAYPGEEEMVHGIVGDGHPYEDCSNAASNASLNLSHQRASISTTTTNSTTISDSTGERHVSTNSTWTSLTRLTSSTSLSKWAEAADMIPESQSIHAHESDEETTPPASKEKDVVPELTPFPSVPVGKRSLHKSHASESIVRDEVPPMKSAEATKGRRPRARTTSLSTPMPPVGQYALFPRTYVKGNGDRI